MMAKALRCLMPSISIATLTPLQMSTQPSCHFSMTAWESQRRLWLSAPILMGWWLDAKLSFLPLAWSFFCSLHSCYDDLLEQFQSRYKSLEGASLDSIVVDIRYHNEFEFVGSVKKALAPKGPKAMAAAAPPHVDKQGKEWNNPYE
jgi:hypothetical protein